MGRTIVYLSTVYDKYTNDVCNQDPEDDNLDQGIDVEHVEVYTGEP